MEEGPQERWWRGRTWPARGHPIVPSQGVDQTGGQTGKAPAQVMRHLPGDCDRPKPVWSMTEQGRAVVELKMDTL